MKHNNRSTLLALLLALVMILSCACAEDGEALREPDSVETGESTGTDSDSREITIAETVVYEADGIRVTATGYTDGWMGPEIAFLVENDSERDVLVTSDALSVNGYMTPYSSLYAQVAAGKKANESLTLLTSELDQSGIVTVAQLQFYLKVADAESWDSLAQSELITLSTSAAGYEQSVDDSGDVLYDDNGIRIICKGLKQDMIWDGTVVFFMENNSGSPITVYAENVSVNGFMQDAGLWSDLRDGTRIIDGMSLLDLSDLQLESIDQVEQIELNLRIIHADTWDEIVTTDVLTLNFE